MIMDIPDGATEFEVPPKFKKLVPKNLKVEAVKLKDGSINLSLIKFRTVIVKLSDIDLTLDDAQLQDKILNPMVNSLNRTFNNV